MVSISLLKNTIQEYAWGSIRAIPDLLGQKNPANQPQAELWMGAHPKAPSLAYHNGQWISLQQLIAQYPENILGKKVSVQLLKYLRPEIQFSDVEELKKQIRRDVSKAGRK